MIDLLIFTVKDQGLEIEESDLEIGELDQNQDPDPGQEIEELDQNHH